MNSTTHLSRPAQNLDLIERIAYGAIDSRALREAILLRLFDFLATPASPSRVASQIGADERAIKALLDLLVARRLAVRNGDDYQNSPMSSEYLVSSSPFYQGDSLLWHMKTCEHVTSRMSELLINPGIPETCAGKNFSMSGTMNAIEQHSKRGFLQDTVEFIESLPGFGEGKLICDIGGNKGLYTTALLDRNPFLKAVIADLPEVMKAAENIHSGSAYGDRLSLLPFNMRTDSLPEKKFDLALASYMLHIFRDTLEPVIEKIAFSLVPGGWFVTQNMAPDGMPDPICMTSMELMTVLAAKVHHYIPEKDITDLLGRTGFTDITSTRSGPGGAGLIIAARKK